MGLNFTGRSFISLNDMDKDELLYLMEKSAEVKEGKHKGFLQGKTVATLFFEPSTRTRLSFETAVLQQGGSIFGFSSSASSSVQKGESLTDTIKTITGYCDAIVMRHKIEGAARRASQAATVPVINAGDGANQHPTQTFLDIFTMMEKKGSLDGKTIGLMGDLKYGRTTHSLLIALSFFNVRLVFISPKELKMPEHYTDFLKTKKIDFEERDLLDQDAASLDFLYCTRIQKERFFDPMEYERVKGSYILDRESIALLGESTYIMHPLPRVDEISEDVDDDHRAIYFEQAHNGVPVRQALLGLVLGTIK